MKFKIKCKTPKITGNVQKYSSIAKSGLKASDLSNKLTVKQPSSDERI